MTQHYSYNLVSVALAICLVGSTLPSLSTASAAVPEEYRTLASHLAMPLKNSPDEFQESENFTEMLSSGHSAVLSLRGINSSDRNINYVAKQAEDAFTEALRRYERINALPKPPGAGELMASSFIDGFFGNVSGGYARGLEAQRMQDAIKNELYPLLASLEKADAAHQMLVTIAKSYSANFTYPPEKLYIDFDEAWGGTSGPHDWFQIYNRGSALRDCTIEVKLTGTNGETRKNVHFVRDWPADSWLYGRYQTGISALDKTIGSMTVNGVKTVEVTVYSPNFSTAVIYTHDDNEKARDIAEYCQGLKFNGRYQPYVTRRFLPDTKRGVEFTLEGVDFIPKCDVTVHFRSGLKSVSEDWQFGYWKKGEKKIFRPKDKLEFDPQMISMEIAFPGTTHKHVELLFPDSRQFDWEN